MSPLARSSRQGGDGHRSHTLVPRDTQGQRQGWSPAEPTEAVPEATCGGQGPLPEEAPYGG